MADHDYKRQYRLYFKCSSDVAVFNLNETSYTLDMSSGLPWYVTKIVVLQYVVWHLQVEQKKNYCRGKL